MNLLKLQSHQVRVLDEKVELDKKLSKLHAFFGQDAFARLPAAEMERLQEQATHMGAYSDVLRRRIEAFVL